jgi:hypothetical protein
MSELPVELFPKIVSSLATPTHPLQVGHSVRVLNALRDLCLVNQYMRRLAIPHLHSTIVIHTEYQVKALLRTYNSSISLCSLTTSLALHYFPECMEVIHSLLYLLGPYLRRLTMFGITATDLGSYEFLARDAL